MKVNTICGSVTYSISSSPSGGVTTLSATQLSVDANGLITVAGTGNNQVGTHIVTLLAKLTSYTTITNSISFTLTVNPCQVTSFTLVTPTDQIFVIGSS